MKFWLILFLAFSVFTLNAVPESASAKTEKSQSKSKKANKTKAKKVSSKKNKAKKATRSRSRSRQLAVAPYAPSYSEFLVDGETGRILHQENANERRYPASLTKMMTIYLAFEQLKAGNMRMNENLRVSAYAASMPKTNLSLNPGSDITLKEAILALVIHSANDAAVVIGENISGDEDRFAALMTTRARQLGMKNTTFKNACGLHDPGQVTTAKDMALLAIALKKHYPEYYDMFSRTAFDFHGRTYESHNRVTRSYSGAEGLKTGYVRASGFNLVTSATRYQGNLVGVVLGGRTAAGRDTRMKELLDAGFEKLAELKKKDRIAGKSAADDAMNIASLEPESGNINEGAEVAPKQQEEKSEEVISKPVKPLKSSVKLPAKKPHVKKQAKPAKHLVNNFVPAPKTKPRKVASIN